MHRESLPKSRRRRACDLSRCPSLAVRRKPRRASPSCSRPASKQMWSLRHPSSVSSVKRLCTPGPAGQGLVMKLVVDGIMALATAALAEGICYRVTAGLDRGTLIDTLLGLSIVAEHDHPKLETARQGAYPARFATRLIQGSGLVAGRRCKARACQWAPWLPVHNSLACHDQTCQRGLCRRDCRDRRTRSQMRLARSNRDALSDSAFPTHSPTPSRSSDVHRSR